MSKTRIEAIIACDVRPLKKDFQEAVAIARKGAKDMDAAAGSAGGAIAGGKGGGKGGKAAGGLLQAASAADDLQYGLRGVLNNVLGIAGYLGPLGKALAATAAIGGVIYSQWDEITGKAKQMAELTKELERLQGQADRAGAVRLRNAAEENALAAAYISKFIDGTVAEGEAHAFYTERRAADREHAFKVEQAQRRLAGKETAEIINQELEMRIDLRKRATAEELADTERLNNTLEAKARQVREERNAAITAAAELREKAQKQEIESGRVTVGLQVQLAEAESRRVALVQLHEKISERILSLQPKLRDLALDRDKGNPQQDELDRLEAARRIADLEEASAKEAAKIREESTKRMVNMLQEMITRAADALKKLKQQTEFRRENAEQKRIDEERARGRERAARKLELDREEKARVKELQEKGGMSEAEARQQAGEERDRKEDSNRGRRGIRRRAPQKERGSLLDEPRGSNLDDGRQRMKDLFEPRRTQPQPQKRSTAPAPAVEDVAGAVAGTIPGGAPLVPLVRQIVGLISKGIQENSRRPVNNPRKP